MANPLSELISRLAPQYGVDPQAALAVAAQEGLGGGVGDNGTSFGPFQLHYGGAYPNSAPHGAEASQAWATSPEGVAYALRQIGGVAGGLHGRSAIENIVRRFERPADPNSEVARALAAYGGGAGSAYGSATLPAASVGGSAAPGQPKQDNGWISALQTLLASQSGPKPETPTLNLPVQSSAAPVAAQAPTPTSQSPLSYTALVNALQPHLNLFS